MATQTIESLTTEQQAIFRSEIGAGTPATTESVLALLEGEELEVASIGLTDGTGTALAAGSLSLNAAGKLVVHDNDSNAEDLPHLVNSLESLNFATRVLATSMNNEEYLFKLAEIPLPASSLTNGKLMHITGSMFSLWKSGVKPDAGAFLLLCKEGQNPFAQGWILPFANAINIEAYNFHIPVLSSVSSDTWTLAKADPDEVCLVRRNNGGTITHAAVWGSDFITNSNINGIVGEPIKLELYVGTLNYGTTVTAQLFISGKLSAIHE